MAGLTQDELKKWLSYDPDTGHFTWIAHRKKVRVGERAGTTMTHGYVCIGVLRKHYTAHRLAWFYVHGEWPEGDLDHINRNRADNRMSNLRPVTRKQNCENSGLRSNNRTGIRGVGWDDARKKWRVQLRSNGHQMQIGRFDDLSEAIAARKAAEQRYFTHAPAMEAA